MLDTTRLRNSTFVARVEHHLTIGSTNDRARECAAKGLRPLPLLILADAQTAGRGRGTNRWWTGRGSLAMSLLFEPGGRGIDRAAFPLLALATGVAVAETVSPLLPGHEVGIHWPNDVMAAGRKLAGILVETLSGGLCVVGIGLNTNNRLDEAPAEVRDTATTLLDLTGIRHDRTAVLIDLLNHLAAALALLADDPAEVAGRADALCLQRGRTLSIESGGGRVTGCCAGIAPDGALLLDTPAGRQAIYSGVVSLASAEHEPRL
jgi:BirA family biotin operon repressor/biotin-[acetyl-CoA-carboxylase] ligase